MAAVRKKHGNYNYAGCEKYFFEDSYIHILDREDVWFEDPSDPQEGGGGA